MTSKEPNKFVIMGGFIDEYLRCPFRLLKCFKENLNPSEFINSDFVKEVLIKSGLQYEKEFFSKFNWTKTSEDIIELIKQKSIIKQPRLVIKGEDINEPSLKKELKEFNLIGVPDMIIPTKEQGYVPVEIKAHKTISRLDKLRLAYYSLMLNSLLKTKLNIAYIILKKDAENFFENLELIELDKSVYLELFEILENIKRMKEDKMGLEPYRKKECDSCKENKNCKDYLIQKGDLTLLHGISANSIKKFKDRGIKSIRDILSINDEELDEFDSLKKIKLKAKSYVDGKIYQKADFKKLEGDLIFLDVETDIFCERIWLIGIENNGKIVQFFAKNYNEEKKILREFLDFLKKKRNSILVTYSGTNFDFKVILNSLKRNKLSTDIFESLQKVDMCSKIRRSFIVPSQSYKLKPLAKFLGYNFRHPDLNGFLVAASYEKCLQENKQLDKKYFEYNEDDCLSLKFLYEQLIYEKNRIIEKVFNYSPEYEANKENIEFVKRCYEENGYLRIRKDKRYFNTIDYEIRIRLNDKEIVNKIIKILEASDINVGTPYRDKGKTRVTIPIYGRENVTKFIKFFKPSTKNNLNPLSL